MVGPVPIIAFGFRNSYAGRTLAAMEYGLLGTSYSGPIGVDAFRGFSVGATDRPFAGSYGIRHGSFFTHWVPKGGRSKKRYWGSDYMRKSTGFSGKYVFNSIFMMNSSLLPDAIIAELTDLWEALSIKYNSVALAKMRRNMAVQQANVSFAKVRTSTSIKQVPQISITYEDGIGPTMNDFMVFADVAMEDAGNTVGPIMEAEMKAYARTRRVHQYGGVLPIDLSTGLTFTYRRVRHRAFGSATVL